MDQQNNDATAVTEPSEGLWVEAWTIKVSGSNDTRLTTATYSVCVRDGQDPVFSLVFKQQSKYRDAKMERKVFTSMLPINLAEARFLQNHGDGARKIDSVNKDGNVYRTLNCGYKRIKGVDFFVLRQQVEGRDKERVFSVLKWKKDELLKLVRKALEDYEAVLRERKGVKREEKVEERVDVA